MEIAEIIYLYHNQEWCEKHINERRFQLAACPGSNQLLSALWAGT